MKYSAMRPQISEGVQLALGMVDRMKVPERLDLMPDPVVAPLQEVEDHDRNDDLDRQRPQHQRRNSVTAGGRVVEQLQQPDERR